MSLWKSVVARPAFTLAYALGICACASEPMSPGGAEVPVAPLSPGAKADSVTSSWFRWPRGDVYLIVRRDDPEWWALWREPGLEEDAYVQLQQAAEELAANTPVRLHFIENEDEAPDGYFVSVTGNGDEDVGGTAGVGTSFFGESSLASGAHSMRHEIGHVLGLHHTHSRSDRDEYVRVHWDHIEARQFSNFFENGSFAIGPYDYGSIMHYSDTAFSADGCATLTYPGDPDACDLEQGGRIRAHRDAYSLWNYVTISAMYCLPKYCGDRCASRVRCGLEEVQQHLRRLSHWEETGEQRLPSALAICGDGYVDEGETCDSSEGCRWDCHFPTCGDALVDDGEECDDGGDTPSCDRDCTFVSCGDGLANLEAGESCDSSEGCDDWCQLE